MTLLWHVTSRRGLPAAGARSASASVRLGDPLRGAGARGCQAPGGSRAGGRCPAGVPAPRRLPTEVGEGGVPLVLPPLAVETLVSGLAWVRLAGRQGAVAAGGRAREAFAGRSEEPGGSVLRGKRAETSVPEAPSEPGRAPRPPGAGGARSSPGACQPGCHTGVWPRGAALGAALLPAPAPLTAPRGRAARRSAGHA